MLRAFIFMSSTLDGDRRSIYGLPALLNSFCIVSPSMATTICLKSNFQALDWLAWVKMTRRSATANRSIAEKYVLQ
jgi:hypothetical protein